MAASAMEVDAAEPDQLPLVRSLTPTGGDLGPCLLSLRRAEDEEADGEGKGGGLEGEVGVQVRGATRAHI